MSIKLVFANFKRQQLNKSEFSNIFVLLPDLVVFASILHSSSFPLISSHMFSTAGKRWLLIGLYPSLGLFMFLCKKLVDIFPEHHLFLVDFFYFRVNETVTKTFGGLGGSGFRNDGLQRRVKGAIVEFYDLLVVLDCMLLLLLLLELFPNFFTLFMVAPFPDFDDREICKDCKIDQKVDC